jgi:hypothetical protein
LPAAQDDRLDRQPKSTPVTIFKGVGRIASKLLKIRQ